MKAFVALLRGINVGGRNVLPMKELVAILEQLGARDVRTYIQSGNVVFASKQQDAARLARKLKGEIQKRRGFEPHILVLERADLERAISQNPFPEAHADPRTVHLGFLASAPRTPELKTLSRLKKDSERFQLIGNVFYLHAPEGVGRSKLAANAEKMLGVPMTDRNWRTVCKIWDMVKETAK